MTVPVLHDPVGDPAAVRVGSRRLVGAAESVGVVARGLSDLNQQAVQAWESKAQRVFSIVADIMSQVIGGSGAVTTDMAGALDRYANVLEGCQSDVRVCRQRLQSFVASTPVGTVPDPVAVNAIVGQANQAYARAGQAARELSAAALNLIGNPTANGSLPSPGDASASFVSRAHSGGLASTHPSAAAFNLKAAHIQAQMNGVMTSLTGLASMESRPNPEPGLFLSSTTIGGNSAGFSTPTDVGSGSTILGGDASPGFALDGGAYAASGQTVVGGSWSPVTSDVDVTYSPPAFTSQSSPGTGSSIGLPVRLPQNHPIIQGITVPQQLHQLGIDSAKYRNTFSSVYFGTPFDQHSPDGRR